MKAAGQESHGAGHWLETGRKWPVIHSGWNYSTGIPTDWSFISDCSSFPAVILVFEAQRCDVGRFVVTYTFARTSPIGKKVIRDPSLALTQRFTQLLRAWSFGQGPTPVSQTID
jgi:hypothetical protein